VGGAGVDRLGEELTIEELVFTFLLPPRPFWDDEVGGGATRARIFWEKPKVVKNNGYFVCGSQGCTHI